MPVTCIQFNPVDENYFISGSLDAKVRIWSIPNRQLVDWSDLREMITVICYTPDDQVTALKSSFSMKKFAIYLLYLLIVWWCYWWMEWLSEHTKEEFQSSMKKVCDSGHCEHHISQQGSQNWILMRLQIANWIRRTDWIFRKRTRDRRRRSPTSRLLSSF